MEGKIIKVQINVTKGEKPVEVESCVAQEGVGIQGDRHIGCGARDVCICRKEIVDWMDAQEVKGLCFARRPLVRHSEHPLRPAEPAPAAGPGGGVLLWLRDGV